MRTACLLKVTGEPDNALQGITTCACQMLHDPSPQQPLGKDFSMILSMMVGMTMPHFLRHLQAFDKRLLHLTAATITRCTD